MSSLVNAEVKYYSIFLGKILGMWIGLGIGFILLSIPMWSVLGNTIFWGIWWFTPIYGWMIIIGWVVYQLKLDNERGII